MGAFNSSLGPAIPDAHYGGSEEDSPSNVSEHSADSLGPVDFASSIHEDSSPSDNYDSEGSDDGLQVLDGRPEQ